MPVTSPPRPRLRSARPRAGGVRVVLAAAALALSGCGSAPVTIDTGGVDGLVVPTPGIAPGDFEGDVVNPWFPLTPGTAHYRVDGPGNATAVEVRTTAESTPTAGVDAVKVHRVVRSGEDVVAEDTAWFATDRAGNVWLVGETGASTWVAGADGAEAGLVMPARPRRGDGFATARVDGEFPVRLEVIATDMATTVATGEADHLVVVQARTAARPGVEEKWYFAPDTGLVLVERGSGADRVRIELVDFAATP
ncbi:hypothetical protein [Nocardioides sp. AE5]|uniref:hypothetical protein n=1 Tax=Nocardioides sp. AE5 TaxID=2962573 RepID=UPI0028810C6B|nr:hypothetical protein [Nocardioides sp. AE5]MDT0201986.1 hypothetical protein [Nocardioides sp. AE5]